jgi:hypothetical protein
MLPYGSIYRRNERASTIEIQSPGGNSRWPNNVESCGATWPSDIACNAARGNGLSIGRSQRPATERYWAPTFRPSSLPAGFEATARRNRSSKSSNGIGIRGQGSGIRELVSRARLRRASRIRDQRTRSRSQANCARRQFVGRAARCRLMHGVGNRPNVSFHSANCASPRAEMAISNWSNRTHRLARQVHVFIIVSHGDRRCEC